MKIEKPNTGIIVFFLCGFIILIIGLIMKLTDSYSTGFEVNRYTGNGSSHNYSGLQIMIAGIICICMGIFILLFTSSNKVTDIDEEND